MEVVGTSALCLLPLPSSQATVPEGHGNLSHVLTGTSAHEPPKRVGVRCGKLRQDGFIWGLKI